MHSARPILAGFAVVLALAATGCDASVPDDRPDSTASPLEVASVVASGSGSGISAADSYVRATAILISTPR